MAHPLLIGARSHFFLVCLFYLYEKMLLKVKG